MKIAEIAVLNAAQFIMLIRSRHPLILIGALGASTLVGCSSNSTDATATTQPVTADAASQSTQKTGTQLWAQNCTRCHNARPSNQYSSQQWELIVHHMRLRANLTGVEQRKITEFLQSGG